MRVNLNRIFSVHMGNVTSGIRYFISDSGKTDTAAKCCIHVLCKSCIRAVDQIFFFFCIKKNHAGIEHVKIWNITTCL